MTSTALTSKQLRIRGWLLIFIGIFLVLLTLIVLAISFNIIQPFPTNDINARAGGLTMGGFAFLGLIFSIGLTGIIGGIIQVITGRHSRRLWAIVFGLWVIFEAAAILTTT